MQPRSHIGSVNSLGFALIGCGRAGERHAAQAGKFGRFVAVCDVNEAAAQRFSRDAKAEPFTDYGTMLRSVQDKVNVFAVSTLTGAKHETSIMPLDDGYDARWAN